MSPRLRVWGACRALAAGARPAAAKPAPFLQAVRAPRSRLYSDDSKNQTPGPADGLNRPGPEAEPEDWTRQAASAAELETNPEENAAQEVAQDSVAQADPSQGKSANAVDDATLQQVIYGGRVATSETQGGLTPAQEEALYREGSILPPNEAETLVSAEQPTAVSGNGGVPAAGHKFPLPQKPYPEGFNLKKRYHPVLEQITRLLMRDGKLSVAQRNMAMVMNFLRTAPAPIYSPKFPLLPGTPPASHLPLNPVLYMTIAVDSVAPLVKVRHVPGAAGGGRALDLPVPLKVRQRRRTAFKWILDVINKKPSKGSGRKQFPHRIAEEIIAVVEGRSSVWDKRTTTHKVGTAARANVGSSRLNVKKRAGKR